MKKKDREVIRTKDLEEVKKTLVEKRAELAKTTSEIYGGKEKNLKKSKNLRREIAQILTIIKEREILEEASLKKVPKIKKEDKKE